MSTYHLSRDGKTFGPYSWEQLIQLRASNQLLATDYLTAGNGSTWMPASSMPGLFSTPALPAIATHAVVPTQPSFAAGRSYGIACNVCHSGTLTKRRMYRLSGPAVVIGYIFLIPSLFGMTLGVLGLIGCTGATQESDERINQRFENDLRRLNFSESVIHSIVDRDQIPSGLSQAQIDAIEYANTMRNASRTGATVGAVAVGAASVGLFVGSFCGGLLGWLLTMKKRVLQCRGCGAVVAAS